MKGQNELKKYYYDFHLHSCLSPCGDNDMTPNNIVNMAKLKGLDMIALTDHNSAGNCPAAMAAGKRENLLVIPGMELCTSEDVHIVCLFRSLDGALSFEKEVRQTLPKIKNRPDIFGEQLILDEYDNVVSKEENLLITGSGISANEVLSRVRAFGGTAFPAHADKTSNGIIAVLGTVPPEAEFCTAELSYLCNKETFIKENPSLQNKLILRNSDAHYLWDISERLSFLEIGSLDIDSVISYIDNFRVSKLSI